MAWVMREDGVLGRLGVGKMVRSYFEQFNTDLKRRAEDVGGTSGVVAASRVAEGLHRGY